MNFFSKLFRSRDKPQNLCRFVGWPFMFGKSAAGQNVNEFTAMQTMAVYACVRILAESIAGLSLHVYEYRGTGKERVPEHPLYLWVVTQCRINSSNSIRQTSHLPAFMRD